MKKSFKITWTLITLCCVAGVQLLQATQNTELFVKALLAKKPNKLTITASFNKLQSSQDFNDTCNEKVEEEEKEAEYTPLIAAAYVGNSGIVMELLQQKEVITNKEASDPNFLRNNETRDGENPNRNALAAALDGIRIKLKNNHPLSEDQRNEYTNVIYDLIQYQLNPWDAILSANAIKLNTANDTDGKQKEWLDIIRSDLYLANAIKWGLQGNLAKFLEYYQPKNITTFTRVLNRNLQLSKTVQTINGPILTILLADFQDKPHPLAQPMVDIIKKLFNTENMVFTRNDEGQLPLVFAWKDAKLFNMVFEQMQKENSSILHNSVDNMGNSILAQILNTPSLINLVGDEAQANVNLLINAIGNDATYMNKKNKEGNTALMLLLKTVNDYETRTLLDDAITNRVATMITNLVAHSADPNIQNNVKETAFTLANKIKNNAKKQEILRALGQPVIPVKPTTPGEIQTLLETFYTNLTNLYNALSKR